MTARTITRKDLVVSRHIRKKDSDVRKFLGEFHANGDLVGMTPRQAALKMCAYGSSNYLYRILNSDSYRFTPVKWVEDLLDIIDSDENEFFNYKPSQTPEKFVWLANLLGLSSVSYEMLHESDATVLLDKDGTGVLYRSDTTRGRDYICYKHEFIDSNLPSSTLCRIITSTGLRPFNTNALSKFAVSSTETEVLTPCKDVEIRISDKVTVNDLPDTRYLIVNNSEDHALLRLMYKGTVYVTGILHKPTNYVVGIIYNNLEIPAALVKGVREVYPKQCRVIKPQWSDYNTAVKLSSTFGNISMYIIYALNGFDSESVIDVEEVFPWIKKE